MLFATGIPFGGNNELPRTLRELAALTPRTAGIRRWGSAALDLAYLAAGRIDGYWQARPQPLGRRRGPPAGTRGRRLRRHHRGRRQPDRRPQRHRRQPQVYETLRETLRVADRRPKGWLRAGSIHRLALGDAGRRKRAWARSRKRSASLDPGARSARVHFGTPGAGSSGGSTSSAASCTASTPRPASTGNGGSRSGWPRSRCASAAGCSSRLASGFAFFDPETGALHRIAEHGPGGPDLRYNNSKCDRRGRFWAGTMYEGPEKRRIAGLARLDPDLSLHAMEKGVGTSNSIAWSPDDRTFYYSDTSARVIWAYDFDLDAGTIGNRRVFSDMDGQPGGPDGSTVDAEGFLWNAQWGGWRLVRYASDGRIDRIVPMPVAQPTSCAFGGPDLATLYVTSARTGLSDADVARQPQAGGLFALDLGVRGLPEPRFAG